MKIISCFLTVSAACFLTACGEKQPAQAPATSPGPTAAASAPAAPAPVAVVPAAAPSPASEAGKAVFTKTCAMCHATGVAGAPKSGNKDDWAPRIAEGKDTLYKHALEGFTGKKGMMPARGANPSLSDDEVKSAVDYMVGLSS